MVSQTILRLTRWLALVFVLVLVFPTRAGESKTIKVHAQPIPGARVEPQLFGNFVELLEDVVPGMWAEMLNDRSFEGVVPAANWSYYDGTPTICDREWNLNPTWERQTGDVFNGTRCTKLTAQRSQPAALSQSGLSVKAGMNYQFSGYFRSDNPKLKISAILRAPLPNGTFATLATAKILQVPSTWEKRSVMLNANGGSDQAEFEIRTEGDGHVWIDKLSLMPTNNMHGWRADVIEAIKELRPAVVRWGGSVVDPGQYHWKGGIGFRDLRVPFPNNVWGRLVQNDVGIDEFCQFCELVGAEPLICVSFADGAQSAGDLAEYCNGSTKTPWGRKRADDGHLAPYRVKYWQIGNEISGDDANYLARIPDFITAIRKAAPSAEILSSFPSRRLLERTGHDLAFVCPHQYTTDFAGCAREFDQLSEMFQTIPGCKDTRIAVTEWNISAGDWGLGRARQMTLQAALLNARYLNLLIRHSDKVKLACRSNIANSYCGAVIETRPGGVLKRTTYYAMQMYAKHARPVPLQVDGDSDALDVCACTSDRGDALTIFAVNSKSEPIPLKLSFEGFARSVVPVKITTLADQLDARQPDVMNHWNAPDRVGITSLPLSNFNVTVPALSVVAIDCAH